MQSLRAVLPCLATMRAPKSKRRGCGTGDHHRQWLNTDPSGLITGSITWGVALSGAYGVFVRGEEGRGGRPRANPGSVCGGDVGRPGSTHSPG